MTYQEWLRERGCGRKRRYPRKRDAQRALPALAQALAEDPAMWAAYRCPHCHTHHLGHKGATP
ncbi:hypothetical protein [Stackebrandtia soli]|uniref:hypothetical protein n=1 Tax=Stackebrandtia soli TaxID=1892856 RepID=UPI0039EA4F9E